MPAAVEERYAVFAGETWHGEGKVVKDRLLYAEDILREYDFDYDVEKRPVFAPLSYEVDEEGNETFGEMAMIPEKFVTVRSSDNRAFGVVGSRYTVVQNRDAFAFLNSLVYDQRLVIESAFSLYGGRQVVIAARKPENILVAGEEHIPYLVFANGFDGKIGTQMLATPTRVVCANTLNIAIRGASNSYKVKHTSRAMQKLMAARQALDITIKPDELDEELRAMLASEGAKAMNVYDNYTDKLTASLEKLATKKIDNRRFNKLLDSVMPLPQNEDAKAAVTMREEKRAEVRSIYMTDDNINNLRGTALGFYNSVVQWVDHDADYKSLDRKAQVIMSGDNLGQRAFDLAMAL